MNERLLMLRLWHRRRVLNALLAWRPPGDTLRYEVVVVSATGEFRVHLIACCSAAVVAFEATAQVREIGPALDHAANELILSVARDHAGGAHLKRAGEDFEAAVMRAAQKGRD